MTLAVVVSVFSIASLNSDEWAIPPGRETDILAAVSPFNQQRPHSGAILTTVKIEQHRFVYTLWDTSGREVVITILPEVSLTEPTTYNLETAPPLDDLREPLRTATSELIAQFKQHAQPWFWARVVGKPGRDHLAPPRDGQGIGHPVWIGTVVLSLLLALVWAGAKLRSRLRRIT